MVAAHYHPNGEMKRHVRAFIYVAAVLGKESKVADALFKLAEVKEVHVIPGRHDIVAVVEVPRKLLEPDAQSIYWFIVERIKTIGDVTDTETLIPYFSANISCLTRIMGESACSGRILGSGRSEIIRVYSVEYPAFETCLFRFDIRA